MIPIYGIGLVVRRFVTLVYGMAASIRAMGSYITDEGVNRDRGQTTRNN